MKVAIVNAALPYSGLGEYAFPQSERLRRILSSRARQHLFCRLFLNEARKHTLSRDEEETYGLHEEMSPETGGGHVGA